jgi:multidrug resistance protein
MSDSDTLASSSHGSPKTIEASSATTDVEKALARKNDDKEDVLLVGFDEDDKLNPRNWTTRHKVWCTFILAMLAFAASLGSSIISPANRTIAAYTNVSDQVMVFDISLYLLGFAFGPILWAPISEIWGRRWSMLPAMFCLGVFSIGTATSKTAASILVTRFFGGVFASAPVSNVSAAMGDMYEPYHRGTAISLYAIAVVGGPTLGPIIGSALTAKVSWRWTEYLQAIFTFAVVALAFFCLPESYAPVLLKRKAQRLRKDTGKAFHHPHEEIKLDVRSILTKHLARPLRMLITEPMITVIAVYASFVYAILYMSLEWLPIVFEDIRGYGPIVSTLPFLGLFIGIVVALAINLGNQVYYHKAVAKNNGKAVPEARLPPMMIGSVLFAGGLFWFGWTSSPKYHWILPTFALGFVGAGFSCIFQQCINVLVDSYSVYAASAVSANTILRSVLAAGLPFAVTPMYTSLGVPVSFSILGALAGIAIPVPFIFAKYGARLRARSSFSQP